MNTPLIRPGNEFPESGQYAEIGPRGGDKGREVTGVKGKTVPPTTNSGNSFKLVDKTKHKK